MLPNSAPAGATPPIAVSVAHAAAMLSLAPITVRRLVKRQVIPAVRVGRAVRIPLGAVLALAKVPPPPEIDGEFEEVPTE